ncbi:16894_t:CDS:1, partial [Gigaspora margarita]
MDDYYDCEFSTHSTSSSTPNTSQWASTLDQDDVVLVSYSQSPPPPSANEPTNNNNNAKRIKFSNKPGLTQTFFEFYKQPGIKPEDKPITKAKCKVEGCQTQYIWHGSTTNLVKHL